MNRKVIYLVKKKGKWKIRWTHSTALKTRHWMLPLHRSQSYSLHSYGCQFSCAECIEQISRGQKSYPHTTFFKPCFEHSDPISRRDPVSITTSSQPIQSHCSKTVIFILPTLAIETTPFGLNLQTLTIILFRY